jgi:hypothetical protein
VHSPTNADVLRDEALDLVIAVSPMSAANARARTLDAPFRWANHRRLERELRVLKSRGTTVVRIEPGSASLRAMGLNAMARDRTERIIPEAFVETGTYLASKMVRARLAPITSRASQRGAC